MRAPRIRVIASAPFPISLPNGRHLAPGECITVAASPRIQPYLKSGALRELPLSTPSPRMAPTPQDDS